MLFKFFSVLFSSVWCRLCEQIIIIFYTFNLILFLLLLHSKDMCGFGGSQHIAIAVTVLNRGGPKISHRLVNVRTPFSFAKATAHRQNVKWKKDRTEWFEAKKEKKISSHRKMKNYTKKNSTVKISELFCVRARSSEWNRWDMVATDATIYSE